MSFFPKQSVANDLGFKALDIIGINYIKNICSQTNLLGSRHWEASESTQACYNFDDQLSQNIHRFMHVGIHQVAILVFNI